MHPALSVILFSTLSGAGFGVWLWLGLRIALGPAPQRFDALGWSLLLVAGAVLAAVGLAASFWHLGKPLRAWRAFSQWRTSWLSREGVCAVACFPLAAALLWLLPQHVVSTRLVAGLLALGSATTIVCTAMIYASLKPIPAWRHRLTVPVYLLFALLTAASLIATAMGTASLEFRVARFAIPVLALLLLAAKAAYWRDIDRQALPAARGDAVGLAGRQVSVFERPHTEANYLTREMGFVVARRHARPLRWLAALGFGVVPLLAALLAGWQPALAIPALWTAFAAALGGAFVERWLFFAQARHMVTLYY